MKIGVALSGGFVRGTSFIGALEVLEENNIPIHAIAGTSAGAGIAAAYAAGRLDVMKKKLSMSSRGYWEVLFEPTISKQSFLKGQRVREFLNEVIGEKKFEDLEKELYIAATDLNSLKSEIISSGSIADAIQASVGVPGIFKPVKRGNKVLTDGGNFNMIPSDILYEKGCDYVIAIDVSVTPNPLLRILGRIYSSYGSQLEFLKLSPAFKRKNPNVFDVVWRATKLSASHIKNFYHHSYRYDILIQPDLEGIKRWEFSKASHLMHLGRAETEKHIDTIKEDLKKFR